MYNRPWNARVFVMLLGATLAALIAATASTDADERVERVRQHLAGLLEAPARFAALPRDVTSVDFGPDGTAYIGITGTRASAGAPKHLRVLPVATDSATRLVVDGMVLGTGPDGRALIRVSQFQREGTLDLVRPYRSTDATVVGLAPNGITTVRRAADGT